VDVAGVFENEALCTENGTVTTTQDVSLYVLGMNRSASLGQCRPCFSFFEQVPMSSVRDVCMVSSNELLSKRSKTPSSALHRLETTIPTALGRSS